MTNRAVFLLTCLAALIASTGCSNQPEEQPLSGATLIERDYQNLKERRDAVCNDLTEFEQKSDSLVDLCERTDKRLAELKRKIDQNRLTVCEKRPLSVFDKASKAMACAVEEK